MARIFITGVAGFLGSHLADAMIADGHTVVGVDNMIGGDAQNIAHLTDPCAFQLIEADCNDFDAMCRAMEGCDIVYHCAATAYEGLSVFSPHIVTQNIVTAATGVFSAAIANGVKRIVHCSSMARYGAGVPPFIEDYTEPRPQDPYGIGKLCAENMLTNLCELHNVEWVIAVPHNIIGPRQKYDDPFRNVASIMINLMLQGRPPVIYGDGTQKRCFSFIDDCLFCLKKMAFQEDVVGQVINIGPDEEVVTIYELFQTIQRLLKTELVPIYMPGRPAEVHHAVCCSSKARAYLDYKTNTTLMAGLSKMIEHIRQRGPKKFEYHLPIEIQNERTPKTWSEKIF